MAVICGDHDLWATTSGAYILAPADHLALVFDEQEIANRNGHGRNYLSEGSDEFCENIHDYYTTLTSAYHPLLLACLFCARFGKTPHDVVGDSKLSSHLFWGLFAKAP